MNKVTKNVIWNLTGSLVYYFSQWLMTVLVVRLSGDYAEAGILALAMSVSAIFFTVSHYAVRNYQVADINNDYNHGTYIALRILTCILSLILLTVYLVISQYTIYTILSILCFMLIRIVEALIDVFQGILQKKWRMDIVGKSLIIRGIVGLLVFGIAEYLFRNIAITCLATALSTAIIAIFTDLMPCYHIENGMKIEFDKKKLPALLLCCSPLFLNGLMLNFIPNFPKIIGEKIFGEELIGYYATVATPAIVVQTISAFCFSPLIPMLAKQFADKDNKIYSAIFKVQALIIGVGVLAIIGFSVLGNWLLALIFGESILPYSYLLLPAVIVSILTASVFFLCALFTVVERNKTLAAVQSVGVLMILTLSGGSLKNWELQGINYILIAAYSVFIVVGYIIILNTIRKHNRKDIAS